MEETEDIQYQLAGFFATFTNLPSVLPDTMFSTGDISGAI
jgi:hypothetical protein